MRYVVVARNPDEAIASMHPFAHAHTHAWFDLWKLPREAFCRPDFASFYNDVAKGLFPPALFGFIAAWWPLRHAKNVLLLHFSDMKADHEGSVRKIARFLGFTADGEAMAEDSRVHVVRWMKAHEDKFELRTVAPVPILDSGAMMRRGSVGAANDDGVTPEISADIARIGREILKDDAALEWFYRGGPLSRRARRRASRSRAAQSRASKPRARTSAFRKKRARHKA